jgi:hypothetical protein
MSSGNEQSAENSGDSALPSNGSYKIRAGGFFVRQPEVCKPGNWPKLQLRQVTLVTLWLRPASVLLAGQELLSSVVDRVGTETAGRRPRREPVGRQLQ